MRTAEDALPDWRTTALGVSVSTALLAVPLLARMAFGVLRPLHLAMAMLFTAVVLACSMGAMTAVFRWSLRRGGSELGALGAAIAVGAPVSAAVCIAWLPLMLRFPAAFHMMPGEPATVAYFLVTGVSDSFMIAVIWAGVFLYPNALRAVHARERALEDARRDAELLRLRSHLEPHFVLNTLNAIAGMVVDEPRVARRLLGALGDLFRDAVSDRASERRSVREELAWLERYAAIVQARYGDALRFEWDAEERAMDMEIPRLLLQPIVENAVAHGALRRSEGGTVRVRVRRDGSSLRCEVEDDGPGPSDAPRREGARGLAMVERRLALEAPGSELVLRKTASGGALAVLRIVQRTES